MKKFLIINLFSLLITLLIIQNTGEVSAATSSTSNPGELGRSCCQTGYSFNERAKTCLNNETSDMVDSIAAPGTCSFLKITSPLMDFSGCKETVSSSYKFILASRPYLQAGGATGICTVFATGSLTSLNVSYQEALEACSKIAIHFINLNNRIAKTQIPPLCDAGLQCSEAGICETAKSSSGPLEPYDPECIGSTGTRSGYKGVKTALGCLPVDPQTFINVATPWAIYLGAGIGFLLGVFGALMIVLSAGNPEKMQAGKEMITSAIGGLILIIFAVLILETVGVKILGLFAF